MNSALLAIVLLVLQVRYCGGWCYDYWDEHLQHDPTTYDPCLDGNHHLITDPTRSADYYDPDSELKNDDYDYFWKDATWEKNGWYRSTIPGAEDIALEKPDDNHCQTERQIYFDAENHNFIYDGYGNNTYEIELSHSEYGCCFDYTCMKHCDNFNVYQLGSHYVYDGWYEGRICFGGDGECRDDDEICQTLFKRKSHVEIAHKSEEKELGNGMCKEEVQFVCQVASWVDGITVNKLKFTWSIGGVILFEEEKQGSDESSTLTMDKIYRNGNTKANFELKCSVQWTTGTEALFGDAISTKFFVGLKLTKDSFSLTEGQSPGYTELTSSIPLGCEYKCNDRTTACIIEVPITYPSIGNNEIALQFDDKYEDTENCETSLHVAGTLAFGATLNIPMSIYPKDDGKYDSTQSVDVHGELITDSDMWNGISFDVRILVHDINNNHRHGHRTNCYFYNDPHAGNFDNSYFETQLAGFFKVFRHKNYPIDIEAYFKNYGGYTGVCGVAVRSGVDLYVVRYCRTPIIAKPYRCGSSPDSSSLIVDVRGNQYHIYLPTGTKVEFREGSLVIYPSESDRDSVEGICGNYNGDSSDDFMLKGTDQTDHNTYAPNDFTNSWRVQEKESLFQGRIRIDDGSRSFSNRKFCECNNKGVRQCSPLPRPSLKLKGRQVSPIAYCRESKRSTEYSDYVTDDIDDEFVFDFDPNFVAPAPEWKNGWSQSLAEDFCNDYLLQNAILQSCIELIDIESVISSCIEDIYITGTTDYAKTQLDMLFSQCIDEVEKYEIVTDDPDSNYTNPYQELFESVCYSDCNGNGMCENGVCQCNENYAGYDCSVDKNHIPTLQPFYFDGLCDRFSRPCQETGVYADLLLDSDNLKCQVQVKDVNYAPVSDLLVHSGVIEHYQKVFCQVPEHAMPYIVAIAISNNNQNYSEPQHLMIYHSTCWQCTLDGGCEKKKSSCVIDQSCIEEAATNPNNADEYCDPALDEYAWSSVTTETDSDSLTVGAIAGIAVASAVVLIAVIVIALVIAKHKGKNKASRVTSELSLGKTHSIVPKCMEENQNGMPPSQDQVDFKTLGLKPGVTPFNRMTPLTPPPNIYDQHTVTVKPADYGVPQPIPELGHVEAVPPVKVDGLYE